MGVKKAFLGAISATIATTAPIAVVISCDKNNSINGISKWKTNLKVGQEYSLEKGPLQATSTIKYAMDEKLARKTMKLQVWLAGYGFSIFSNITSMFDYLLDDMPDIRLKHDLDVKETKLLGIGNRTISEDEELKTVQKNLTEIQEKIDNWVETKLSNLQNKARNKIQGIIWTSRGVDVLKNHPRTYKITDIKDTTEGVAIKTTLSTLPPKGKIDGYSMRTWVEGSRNPITVKGVEEDIKALWKKLTQIKNIPKMKLSIIRMQ